MIDFPKISQDLRDEGLTVQSTGIMSALVSRMPDKQQARPKSTFQAASVDNALLMLLLTAKAAAFLSLLASLLQPAQQPPLLRSDNARQG